ncbi:MAG: fused MFS/spermidine synthase [Armatimonadota bacterium]|nr:fused MFS/spermidine synthase [Armatimonadota bacterium]MDR7422347.1 fused MFS/spermidine synthase [Armatimonadota bacterium]MDR7454053.1 fused MFS/spermidine synthase [Armatimonadota bacterium]MDR7457286.1 fused MFS/spermidine synthase [Armatimonadota bacterium]MDR7497152.1 fused MFS/spermidine synthase [Armatimonadota bacterium]
MRARPGAAAAVLVAMAVASGAAALVYQVVWMRRLVLVFGSTTLATSTVLAAFLGGLAVGAWLWGVVADRRPAAGLAVFGLVEAATGLYALASPWAFGAVDAAYLAAYGPLEARPALLLGVQFALCALVIVPPAALMGGTLPLLVRRLVVPSAGASPGVAVLYGGNTVGAALGAAAATYGLLPALGLGAAVRLAASVNLLIGAAALFLDAWERGRAGARVAAPAAAEAEADRDAAAAAEAGPGMVSPDRALAAGLDPVSAVLVLQAFALSGFAAMTYEVAWARLLALVMGSSVYAFGTLVVVVLAALGAGSALYARVRTGPGGHLAAFGALEVLIAASGAASLLVAPALPYLFLRFFPAFRDAFAWQLVAYVGLAALLAFVPFLLLGATFPAVVGSLGGTLARLGRSIGVAYAANTAGTVLGAFLAGFVLIPAVGLRATVVVGVLASAAAGVVALLLSGLRWPARAALLLPAAAALAVVASLPPWPREVFAAGIGFFASRYADPRALEDEIRALRLLYYRDGVNTTISVDQVGDHLVYRSNGKTDASTFPSDMSTQILLGHLPMLRHPAPREVFVLGLGTGVTAAAVARYPVVRLDILELEPAGVEASRFFDRYNRGVLRDPRARLILSDGRNRLRAASDAYDVIISDPSDLWVAGTGALYTVEFYRDARARLRPGGLMVQWLHTHALRPEDLAVLIASFRAVFPAVEVWAPAYGDLILIGSGTGGWDYRGVARRIAEVPGVADDLRAVGFWHPAALFAARVGGTAEAGRLAAAAPGLNTDDHPRLEFATPRALYAQTIGTIDALLDEVRVAPWPALAGFDPARDLDAHATYLLGFAHASLGRPRAAIPLMERAAAAAPDRPAYLVGLGHQYRAAGRSRDAEDAYARALDLDPNNVEALTALGEVLLEAGRAERALTLAERALRLSPGDTRARELADRARAASR